MGLGCVSRHWMRRRGQDLGARLSDTHNPHENELNEVKETTTSLISPTTSRQDAHLRRHLLRREDLPGQGSYCFILCLPASFHLQFLAANATSPRAHNDNLWNMNPTDSPTRNNDSSDNFGLLDTPCLRVPAIKRQNRLQLKSDDDNQADGNGGP